MSTDTNIPINQEDNIQENNVTDTADKMREQFSAVEIPANIDPRLLELWLYRERQEIERRERQEKKRRVVPCGRSLGRVFAAFAGIVVMMTMIVLGLVQGKEVNDILANACIAFLVYTVLGFLIGYFVEGCVSDSVETLLNEILERGKEQQENNTQ
jgi:hypothetical protein